MKNWYKLLSFLALVLVGLVFLFSWEKGPSIIAQGQEATLLLIRVFDTDNIGALNAVGLAYSPVTGELLVLEAGKTSTDSELVRITADEHLVGSVAIGRPIDKPANLAFDAKGGRLLFVGTGTGELFEMRAGPSGTLDPKSLKSNGMSVGRAQGGANGIDAQGMVVDPRSGYLYILDSAGLRLLRAAPDAKGSFQDARFTSVDLSDTGLDSPRGLALDPSSGHFHVVNPGEGALYELSRDGRVTAVRDLEAVGVSDPQGMVFAPSGDSTDDPAQMSLYLSDGGQIVELSFEAIVTPLAASYTSTLVQTIDTSAWSPPSPDPAGIVYLPDSDTLLVSDCEVNEMTIYAGANEFESTLTGNLLSTFTTVPWSDEPTGVTYNPINKHLFFSDDTMGSIYELYPGFDKKYGTADDSVQSFSTQTFKSDDPEGVTYVPPNGVFPAGALFIADGLDHEIYRVTPGSNMIFDGIPPEGDDQWTSFDTKGLGLRDPEGIAYNPDNGHLYAVNKPNTTLFEITITGALVQTIDISAAKARSPAGLAYGPNSQNASLKSIYLTARGVDNNADPNENDGKIYELTLPQSSNLMPVAVDDNASTPNNLTVNIDVAANDSDPDGNLDPTTANNTCTGCTNPAHGTLLNKGDGTFDYTPNSSYMGTDTFVYEICDTGNPILCDTATVYISVTQNNNPPVANDDFANTQMNTSVFITTLANDSDPEGSLDSNSVKKVSDPANGTATHQGNGIFEYQPDLNFSGPDSFVYEVCDSGNPSLCDSATVYIVVGDAPVANDDNVSTMAGVSVNIVVTINDSDPDHNLDPSSANTNCTSCTGPSHGAVQNIGNGIFRYTPNPQFIGSDSFVYEVCDSDGLCDTATVWITVNAFVDLGNYLPVVINQG